MMLWLGYGASSGLQLLGGGAWGAGEEESSSGDSGAANGTPESSASPVVAAIPGPA